MVMAFNLFIFESVAFFSFYLSSTAISNRFVLVIFY